MNESTRIHAKIRLEGMGYEVVHRYSPSSKYFVRMEKHCRRIEILMDGTIEEYYNNAYEGRWVKS